MPPRAPRKPPATKKSPAQLDREIKERLGLGDRLTWGTARNAPTGTVSDFTLTVGSGLHYRVTVAPDFDRGGYSARLVAAGAGVVMNPNGTSPSDALTRLARELWAGDATDQQIAKQIKAHAWFPLQL